MRLPLICPESELLLPIYDEYIQKEDTLDYVIPDVRGDVGKILDVRGQLLTVSRKASEGKVILCVSVRADVIYQAEGSGETQCVSTVIPADRTIPVPDADGDTQVYADVCLCSIDARTINPRKLNLRCETGITLRCWKRETVSVCSGVEPEAPVCVLTRRDETCAVQCVGDKYFTVSDSYSVPEGLPQSSTLLSSNTRVFVREVKAVGNKLIFKADAVTDCVLICSETGRLFNTDFISSFSQLIEMPLAEGCDNAYVCVLVCGAELKEESGAFSAELSLSAHGVCCKKREIAYIADAYSNSRRLTCEAGELELTHLRGSATAALTLRGRLPLSAELTELCYLSVAAVCVTCEGAELNVSALVSGVGRDEDGDLCAPQLKLSECCKIETGEGETVKITAASISPVTVSSGFELCVEAEVEYMLLHRCTVTALTGLELEDECPHEAPRPSVTVLCSDNGEDLWSIAKRCGSTVELIERVNASEGQFSPEKRPLLVPRA